MNTSQTWVRYSVVSLLTLLSTASCGGRVASEGGEGAGSAGPTAGVTYEAFYEEMTVPRIHVFARDVARDVVIEVTFAFDPDKTTADSVDFDGWAVGGARRCRGAKWARPTWSADKCESASKVKGSVAQKGRALEAHLDLEFGSVKFGPHSEPIHGTPLLGVW